MKYTDYQKVFELAKNILENDKQMLLLTDNLGQELKKLEGTFLDDGIDEVKAFVNTLTKKLTEAQSAFSTIAIELQAFGEKLMRGKS